MRFLIVDDEFSTRMILKEILIRYGDCDICVNGQEALEAVTMSLDVNRPYDVVFMDVLMPVMGGLEAVTRIRDMESGRNIIPKNSTKIVMLSVVDEVKTVMDAFKKGEAVAYLIKPLDMDKLADTLQSIGIK